MNVAVIGAGPSGSAAAIALARMGAAVTIYERERWPRVKACGDGITPTSIAELDRLGIALPGRRRFPATVVGGPGGGAFRAPWPVGAADGTTMPRRDFDDVLVRAAVAAGATFLDATTVTACAADGTLTIRSRSGAVDRQAHDVVLLAEGATGGLAATLGFPAHDGRLAAYRGYVDTARDLDPAYQVHYARAINPGYAWIFPVDTRRANVGVCVVRRDDVRAQLARWIATDPTARTELAGATGLAEGKGGVIPIGRAQRVARRVFALGDAAGVADPLSAEGISQALGTARLAVAALRDFGGDTARAGAAYVASVRGYDTNNREALRMRQLFAWLADPMVAIARRRPRFARFVVASGYFPKHDASWFFGTFANL